MATDEEYMAFLDKANADPSAGVAKTSSTGGGKVQLKTVDHGAEIPHVLKAPTDKEEWIYVSDADEPFVAVCLKLDEGKLPDEETFAKLINHPDPAGADIQILDIVEWDSGGQYKDVVEACRKAAMGGDIRVYKVRLEGTRVEYWVVGVEGESKRKGDQSKLVGVKALAVES